MSDGSRGLRFVALHACNPQHGPQAWRLESVSVALSVIVVERCAVTVMFLCRRGTESVSQGACAAPVKWRGCVG